MIIGLLKDFIVDLVARLIYQEHPVSSVKDYVKVEGVARQKLSHLLIGNLKTSFSKQKDFMIANC